MLCRESERVQAHFDGDVDAVTAAEIERHVQHCTDCRTLLEDLTRIRAVIRRSQAAVKVPADVKERIGSMLDREDLAASSTGRPSRMPLRRMKPFWLGVGSGAFGAAAAAGLCAFLLFPRLMTAPLSDALVAAHVRSLSSQHLIDVISTDKHTVKPWFAGKADVSPVVADFDQRGFRLLGGRTEILDHQRAAVLVYRHGAHVINVFAWAVDAPGTSRDITRNGYHLAFWRAGNLAYCAVSDTSWEELEQLTGLLKTMSAHDTLE